MGLFSWIFPNDQDLIKRARKLMARNDPAGARAELEGVEGDEAQTLRSEAQTALIVLNLERAEGEITSGELDDAAQRLELATQLDDGSHAKALRTARKALRKARKDAPRSDNSLLGAQSSGSAIMGGGGALATGGVEVPIEAPSPGFGADPMFSLPPDDPRVRYALLLETYPDDLREQALEHGEAFARAVLDVEDGKSGVEARFKPFIANSAIARFERARAALASSNMALATSDLQAFGDAYGHQRVGPLHTGVLVCQLLTGLERLGEALGIAHSLRAAGDNDLELSIVHANLLEATDDLPAADTVLKRTIRHAPTELALYKMLARVRLKGGERVAAMQALESGLRTCCTPGKGCGSKPMDPDAALLLIRLYREDRVETKRADELYEQIAIARKTTDWIDRYLDALRERNSGADVKADADALMSALSDAEDPRRQWVQQQLLAAG